MNSVTLALISYVSAFGIVTIRSGSQYQYSAVKLASNGRLSLNGESDAEFTLDSGKLTVNGQGISVTGGRLVAGSTYSSAFGQEDVNLTYDGSEGFVVCPDNNNEIAFAGQGTPSDCTNAVGVALYISDASSSSSSAASSSASSTETSSESSSAASETSTASTETSSEVPLTTQTSTASSASSASDAASTDVVEQTVTETVCTKESCTGVASANGAVKNGLFMGAAGAVAAALL